MLNNLRERKRESLKIILSTFIQKGNSLSRHHRNMTWKQWVIWSSQGIQLLKGAPDQSNEKIACWVGHHWTSDSQTLPLRSCLTFIQINCLPTPWDYHESWTVTVPGTVSFIYWIVVTRRKRKKRNVGRNQIDRKLINSLILLNRRSDIISFDRGKTKWKYFERDCLFWHIWSIKTKLFIEKWKFCYLNKSPSNSK